MLGLICSLLQDSNSHVVERLRLSPTSEHSSRKVIHIALRASPRLFVDISAQFAWFQSLDQAAARVGFHIRWA